MAAKAPRPRSRTIPAALHDAVLLRLRETDPETRRTYTAVDVAKWLEEAHQLRVSSRAVYRLRAAAEKHTDAQLAAALREEMRELLAPTKAKLSRALRRLDAVSGKSKSTRDLAAAVNATARALESLADLSGVSAPTQIDLAPSGPLTLVWTDAPRADDPPAPAAPEAAGGGG